MNYIPNISTSPYDGEAINVVVGPGQVIFGVHMALNCHYSAYFEAAMKHPFEEKKTKIVTSDDESTETFRTFVHWLYTGHLLAFIEDAPKGRTINQQEAITAWIFGDKRGASMFQNAAINAWREDAVSFHRVGFDHKLIYENTAPGVKLRKMYADTITCVSTFEYFKAENKDDLPKDFLSDVLEAMKDVRLWMRSSWWDSGFDFGCRFHEHGDGEHCRLILPLPQS